MTDINTDGALNFLRGCGGDRPWCLSVSFNAPHAQETDLPERYVWPPSAEGMYRDAVVPPPANSEPEFFNALPEFLKTCDDRRRWRKFSTPEVYQNNMKGMYRMVSGVDASVGRILTELGQLGMSDNTVVIYASDHGMLFGERGLGDCSVLYEQPIRIPMIIYDPREGHTRRGQVSDRMVLNIDVAPTILDLAGLAFPQQTEGACLLPLIRGEDPPWRGEVFLEHLFKKPGFHRSKGVRTERWKYINYFEQHPPYEELYDLDEDPNESVNLSGSLKHEARLNDLRGRCDNWTDRLAPTG